MSDPVISVILPTRNRPHLLPRAVASVLGQTGPELELIVIDDNEPENRFRTREVLAPWQADLRLRIIVHGTSRNASAARNAGLAVARGTWISYLDDDDTYAPGKLAAQLACAEGTRSPLVLCALRYHLGPRVRVRQVAATSFAGAALVLDAQAAAPALFHRREGTLFFDETLDAGEDQDFFLRLVERWDLNVVPNVAEPLVDVYPQTSGPRVNAPARTQHRAQRLLCLHHAPRHGREVRRLVVARTALVRQRGRTGGWLRLWRASVRLYAVGGRAECRLILNTWMIRIPGLRRLAVS